MKTVKVSDSDVKVNISGENEKNKNVKIKGQDWFPALYSNIALIGKKMTGKTTCIENILRKCSGKNTSFIFIGSTVNKDNTWREIIKFWEKKDRDVFVYDGMRDDEGDDVLNDFVEEKKQEAREEEEEKQAPRELPPPPPPRILMVGLNGRTNLEEYEMEMKRFKEKKSPSQKQKKPKSLYPETIIVLDDMGKQLRNKNVTALAIKNRHFKIKLILSAQDLKFLSPDEIQQLDYVLVFGGMPLERLESLREDLLIDLPFTELQKMYQDATQKENNFLYIGRSVNGHYEFRKNFSQKYVF